MSGFAVRWALNQTLSPHGKLVLVALAERIKPPEAAVWPSIPTLATDTGLSQSTVRRQLLALAAANLVTCEPRQRKDGGQTTNQYRLHLKGAGVTSDTGGVSDSESPPLSKQAPTNMEVEPEGEPEGEPAVAEPLSGGGGITIGVPAPEAVPPPPPELAPDVAPLLRQPDFSPPAELWPRIAVKAERIRQFNPDWSLADEVLGAVEHYRRKGATVTAGNLLNRLELALKFARNRAGGRPVAQRGPEVPEPSPLSALVAASAPPPASLSPPAEPMRPVDPAELARFRASRAAERAARLTAAD